MAHYVFQCKTYPEFSLNVPAMARDSKAESKVVHFHRGILDTMYSELTEEEAEATLAALQKLRQRPGWETDIKILAKVEDDKKESSHARR